MNSRRRKVNPAVSLDLKFVAGKKIIAAETLIYTKNSHFAENSKIY